MGKKIMFRMAARCEAAGRPNNEDNYQLSENLAEGLWGFTADKVVEMGPKGSLLVVCDGMGGMNAGEVASNIAVETVKKFFAAENLTDKVLSSPMNFIGSAIKEADRAIKAYGVENPETAGMGSTIVMAWALENKLYVGWCGDSRCYCYNAANGLVRLSHDHSYVQELVDAGKLTEELAFDHPNNNIITRSLGDPNGPARPDVQAYDLHNDDIIMLCSDGLCGCLRDNEIEEQMRLHCSSMQECRDALWVADQQAGWHDNVTICLLQVVSGGVKADAAAKKSDISDTKDTLIAANRRLKIIIVSLIAILVLAGTAVVALKYDSIKTLFSKEKCEDVKSTDSLDGKNAKDTKATTKKVEQKEPEQKAPEQNDKETIKQTVDNTLGDKKVKTPTTTTPTNPTVPTVNAGTPKQEVKNTPESQPGEPNANNDQSTSDRAEAKGAKGYQVKK